MPGANPITAISLARSAYMHHSHKSDAHPKRSISNSQPSPSSGPDSTDSYASGLVARSIQNSFPRDNRSKLTMQAHSAPSISRSDCTVMTKVGSNIQPDSKNKKFVHPSAKTR